MTKVIPQAEWDYDTNLILLKPDLMVHGDDWSMGHRADKYCKRAFEAMSRWGGQIIEIPYTRICG
jgi:phosphoenolpyruvate phosphomutase / 2-hydroxyethylphosphonate cytidylyltransferase